MRPSAPESFAGELFHERNQSKLQSYDPAPSFYAHTYICTASTWGARPALHLTCWSGARISTANIDDAAAAAAAAGALDPSSRQGHRVQVHTHMRVHLRVLNG